MTDTTAAPAPVPEKSGLWEDFIDIFYRPSDVFDRRREGQFGLALLILVVATTALYFMLQNGLAPIIDAEISKQIAAMVEKNPAAADQAAASRGMMEKFALFGVIIFVPIGVLLTAVVLWILGRLVDAKIAFAAAMMIGTYAQFPRIAETILNALQGLLLPPEAITSRYSVQLGPARFLDPDSVGPFLMTLIGGLDVFTIWVTVLLAIGLSVVGRIPIGRAAIAAAGVWLVTLLPQLYSAISAG